MQRPGITVLLILFMVTAVCDKSDYPYLIKNGSIIYDAAKDFSSSDNPSGVWSYGYTLTIDSELQLTAAGALWYGMINFTEPVGGSIIYKNQTSADIDIPLDHVYLNSGKLVFHPGCDSTYSVIRWTAPSDGECGISAMFELIDRDNGSTDVHIFLNNRELYKADLRNYPDNDSFLSDSFISVSKGDTIDFKAGTGADGVCLNDSTMIDAVITLIQ